jgi:hypothetical protein
MGDCKGLKSIYRLDTRKRQRGGDKDGNKNDHWDDKRPDEEDKTEEDRDKDPRHAYKDPDRRVCSIFGGKVALKNERQRKLTARPVMALNNSDEKVANPKYQTGCTSPLRSAELTSGPIFRSQGVFPLFWILSSGTYGSRRCSTTVVAPSTSSSTML